LLPGEHALPVPPQVLAIEQSGAPFFERKPLAGHGLDRALEVVEARARELSGPAETPPVVAREGMVFELA
jgi:hypothetical protein